MGTWVWLHMAATAQASQPPVVDDQLFGVLEHRAAGTPIGTVVASDPDPGDTLLFSISASNVGDAFAIDSTSGELSVADSDAIDYETTTQFPLTVEVVDPGLLTDTATITVDGWRSKGVP